MPRLASQPVFRGDGDKALLCQRRGVRRQHVLRAARPAAAVQQQDRRAIAAGVGLVDVEFERTAAHIAENHVALNIDPVHCGRSLLNGLSLCGSG
jgi:hypothetical protein